MEGQALRRLGDNANSREAFQKALEIRHGMGVPRYEAETLLEMARLDRDDGHLVEANEGMTSALALVESLRSNIGSREARMRIASAYRGTTTWLSIWP